MTQWQLLTDKDNNLSIITMANPPSTVVHCGKRTDHLVDVCTQVCAVHNTTTTIILEEAIKAVNTPDVPKLRNAAPVDLESLKKAMRK